MTARVRLRFTKTGRVRFLSHLDFMTLFHRSCLRAGIPVAFSQGFNPHPKIAFGPALSVGIESEAEYLDLETDPFTEVRTIEERLNTSLPPGLAITGARAVPRTAPSLSGSIGRYEYRVEVPAAFADGVTERIERFLARTSVVVTREGRSKELRPCIEAIAPDPAGGALLVVLQDKEPVKPRIQDVVALLFEITTEQALLFMIKRTGMYERVREAWLSPLDR